MKMPFTRTKHSDLGAVRPADVVDALADEIDEVVDRAGAGISAVRWGAGIGILSVSILAGAALARTRRRKGRVS